MLPASATARNRLKSVRSTWPPDSEPSEREWALGRTEFHQRIGEAVDLPSFQARGRELLAGLAPEGVTIQPSRDTRHEGADARADARERRPEFIIERENGSPRRDGRAELHLLGRVHLRLEEGRDGLVRRRRDPEGRRGLVDLFPGGLQHPRLLRGHL